MKKNNNKKFSLKKLFPAIIVLGILSFLYLFIYTQIKQMVREKRTLETQLAQVKDRMEGKIVKIQKLSSEERIVKIAENRLGLIQSGVPRQKIIVDRDKIQKIQKIVNNHLNHKLNN